MPVSGLDRLDDAYSTVRRQRTVRVMVSAAAAMVVVVAGVAFAFLRGAGGDPIVGSTTLTPSVGPTSPSPTATANPGPPAMTVLYSGALNNARLDVPSFGVDKCPNGQLQFTGGRFDDPGTRWVAEIELVREADVNGDGVPDVLAKIMCYGVNTNMDQVTAFTRDGSGWRTLGRVAALSSISLLGVEPDATVVITRWLDYSKNRIEQRRYRWGGTAFVRQGTPTEVAADPPGTARLSVSAARSPGGGTFTVSVLYDGGPTLDSLWLEFNREGPFALGPAGGELVACGDEASGFCFVTLQVEGIAPGTTVVGTFDFTYDGAVDHTLTVGVQGMDVAGRLLNNDSDRHVTSVPVS